MLHPISVDIPYKSEITIMPLGCIHWPHTDRMLLNAWVNRVKKTGAFVLLLGDTFDWSRSTVRNYMRGYVGDSNSMKEIDRWVVQDILKLAAILKPIRKQIIGIVKGNHNHILTSMGSINSEQYLAQQLGTNYLGSTGIVRLDLVDTVKERKFQRDSLVIWLHHTGGSNAVTPAAVTTALIKQRDKIDADIYITAHTHDCFGRIETVRRVNRSGSPHIVEEDLCFVKAGCLRKKDTKKPSAMEADDEDYAVEKAYSPKRLGWPEIYVNIIKRNVGTTRPNEKRMRVLA